MPRSCRAIVNVAPQRCHMEEVALPHDLNGGALGEVLTAGVCGSDITLYRDGDRTRRPLILGHENIVRLVEVDSLTQQRWNVSSGERVAVEEFVPCGHCRVCRAGRYRLCPRTDYSSDQFLRYGRTPLAVDPGLWGGFSEFLYIHPDAVLHKVPETVPDEHAALFVPLANGMRWVRHVAQASPGEPVVILGPGAHGLGCAIAAIEVGAHPVIVVGLRRDAHRLDVAQALGAHATLIADEDDVDAAVHSLTRGRMAGVVVEVTTGAAQAVHTAVSLAGPGGRVVLAGGRAAVDSSLLTEQVLQKELSIFGVRGHDAQTVGPALELLAARRYPLHLLTTHYPLADTEIALRSLTQSEPNRPIHAAIIP